MRLRIISLASLVALALIGCSEDSRRDGASTEKPLQEKSASDRAVITVNGRVLYQTNLNERVELMVQIATIANPNMKLSDLARLRKKLRSTLQKAFVREVAFDEFARANKIRVDEAAVDKARKSLMAALGDRKPRKYESLRRKVGPLAAVLDGMVQAQATEGVVRQHILGKNPFQLPPNYVSEQMARIKAYNSEMSLTNAQVFVRATNVWEKLKAGADFKQMARQFSEVPKEAEEGGEWGNLGLQQLEPDEDLVNWAQKLQPGEFSPPIDGDNGLMSLKVDSKKGDDYALSRIYFRLPMFQQEVSEEELLKLKRQQHERTVLQKELNAIVESVDVEKPKKKRNNKKKREKLRKGGKKAVEKVLPLRSESVKGENGATASENTGENEGLEKTDLVGGANNQKQEQEEKQDKGNKR